MEERPLIWDLVELLLKQGYTVLHNAPHLPGMAKFPGMVTEVRRDGYLVQPKDHRGVIDLSLTNAASFMAFMPNVDDEKKTIVQLSERVFEIRLL